MTGYRNNSQNRMPEKGIVQYVVFLVGTVVVLFLTLFMHNSGIFIQPVEAGTDDNVSGWAWSSNIGWITFDPSAGSGSGCTSAPCTAKLDFTTGIVTGWARACSVFSSGCSGSLKDSTILGGWDGWIRLDAVPFSASSPETSGVNLNLATNRFRGFAWGGEVIGWVNFAPVIPQNVTVIYTPPVSALPDLTAINTEPAEGTTVIPGISMTFKGLAKNISTFGIPEGGWADLEIDWDSDNTFANYNAFGGSQLGVLAPNESKVLSYTVANVPLGTHRYRFNVDVTNVLDEGVQEGNNRSEWVSFTVANSASPVCPETTIDSCYLEETPVGDDTGSCVAGYSGSCNYTCMSDSSWSRNSNACTIPTGDITGDPLTVVSGGTSKISWTTTNATLCEVTSDRNGDRWTDIDAPSGHMTSGLTADTTYMLVCNGRLLDTVTIRVKSQSITATPRLVEQGGTSVISYHTGGQSCVITGGGLNISVTSTSFTPLTPPTIVNARTTFTLSCPLGIDSTTVEVIPKHIET